MIGENDWYHIRLSDGCFSCVRHSTHLSTYYNWHVVDKEQMKKKLQESDPRLRYDLSESTNHGLVHFLRCPEAWGHILISPPVLCICSHGSGTQSERSTNSQSPAKIYYSAETLNWTFVCKLWSTTWTLNFNISLYWILPNCVSTLDLTNYPGGHFLTATIHPSLTSMDFIWSCHRNRSYILNSHSSKVLSHRQTFNLFV